MSNARHHTRSRRYVPISPEHAELVSKRVRLVDEHDKLQEQHKQEEAIYKASLERYQDFNRDYKTRMTAVCAELAEINRAEREMKKAS